MIFAPAERYNRAVSTPPVPITTALAAALDLFDLGIQLMRQNLIRENPRETSEQIEQRLAAWFRERPGAAFGDAQGRPIPVTARFP